MANKKVADFGPVFDALKAILRKHEGELVVQEDKPTNYCLLTKKEDPKGKPIYFGSARLGKAYVSYHLFPLYCCAELQDDISEELRKRKQGKTCFNFKEADTKLFKELEALTKKGLQRFKKMGLA